MIRAAAALVLGLAAAAPQVAGAQAELDRCAVRAQLLLLPEDLAELDAAPAGALTVTGGYTSAETRDAPPGIAPSDAEGDETGPPQVPAPVGLLVSRGRVVGRQLARMDGIALIAPDGALRITPRDRLAADLSDPAARAGYLRGLAQTGGGIFQSHLLIRDGALDLRARQDAPRAVRRLLLQYADGTHGLWQSPEALTLHEAAERALAETAPAMALNLDMGGHDFCERQDETVPQPCGLVGREGLERFSSLLRLIPAC
ncbi:MAG: hypothetical protein AAF763_13700 [Pseudomonadota bacterium]